MVLVTTKSYMSKLEFCPLFIFFTGPVTCFWSMYVLGIFPSPSCVHITLWIHHMDTNKMHREKTRLELQKNVACCLEQILEATSPKTAVIEPLTSHLTSHSCKTNEISRALLEKQKQTHKWHSLIGRPAKAYLHQVCADIRYTLKDWAGGMDGWMDGWMDDRDGEWKRAREICVVHATWSEWW